MGHKTNKKIREDNLCPMCGKEKDWKNKFCSHECYSKSKVGEKHSWGYKIGNALRGKPKSPEHIRKVIEANRGRSYELTSGSKNYKWKGDDVGYSALHDWVWRELGKPRSCEKCGRKTEIIKGMPCVHWANKSHEYKREINDWIALCRKCHYKHDIKTQTWGKYRWQ